jgi:antitoxin (DNA-binding transcriptional repressor) of toxin-antitoxin stability system
MPIFTIRQAKANLCHLIDEAHKGEEIIIARGSDQCRKAYAPARFAEG